MWVKRKDLSMTQVAPIVWVSRYLALLHRCWREIKNKHSVACKVRLDKGLLERYPTRIVHKVFLRLGVMEGGIQAHGIRGFLRCLSSDFQGGKVGHGLR